MQIRDLTSITVEGAKQFEPSDRERTISFKGHFLAILKKEHVIVQECHDPPTINFQKYQVPAGYLIRVRQGLINFEEGL